MNDLFRRAARTALVGTLTFLGTTIFPASANAANAGNPRAAGAKTALQFLGDEAEPQFDLSFAPISGQAGGRLSVVFDWRDDKNFYALDLDGSSATLRASVGGAARVLGKAACKIKDGSTVVLQRRPWLMQVIVDRRVILTTYDATFSNGKIGSATSDGWNWKEARVQPVEEIAFADDFTRADLAQNGDWKNSGGAWKLTSASSTVTVDNREMSANPFSYEVATPQGAAFAQNGRWFWDNYEASVSVRPMSGGAVGLAFYVQDAKNYLAFIADAGEGPQARRLVRVVDGRESVLASTRGALLPRQWYRLSVRTSPNYLETFIDGAPIFKTNNDFFGQGGIALLAKNIANANFDDASVKSNPFFRLDFSQTNGALTGGGWQSRNGAWKAKNRVLVAAPAAGEKKAPVGAARFLLTGRTNWTRYRMTVAAQAGEKGACGLLASYLDEKNYALFRWAGAASELPFRGRQQMVRVRNGQAKIIQDAPLKIAAASDGFARVTAQLATGAFTVYGDDGDILAQMTDESLYAGRAGLWSQGKAETSFRDASVTFLEETPPLQVAPRMASDALMVQYGWASPAGEWKPVKNGDATEFWNTGDFFSDASLGYQWPRGATGKIELALRAQRGEFASGWVVRCEGAGEGKPLILTLLHGTQIIKRREYSLKPRGAEKGSERVPLRVDWAGRALMVSVGGRPALSYLSSSKVAAANATSFAARAQGFTVNADDLRAASPHRDDYTFTAAPTDWYAPQGNWGVTARWPCTSAWSFFGTKGTAPVLWSKRTFNQDVVVEAYIHNQMDLPAPPYYTKPGNLNITIAGDGKNPLSGYSFLFAGWHNTKSAIFRGQKVVAENATEQARYARPIVEGAMEFHRGWTYLRASVRRATKDGKDGVQVTFVVNDSKIAEYFDPAPLASFERDGRIAFWTVNSSLSMARVKVESAANNGRDLPSGLLDATPQTLVKPPAGTKDMVPRPGLDDGLAASQVSLAAENKSGSPTWLVRDPASGGTFAIQMARASEALDKTSTWPVTARTRFEMDWAPDADTKLDLYFTVDGAKHLVQLSDVAKSESGKTDAAIKMLGDARPFIAAGESVEGSESGAKWQHVTYDLGAALQKLYPAANAWNITDITLGALHGDDYRWIGANGNSLGASYLLRHARFLENAAPEKPAAP